MEEQYKPIPGYDNYVVSPTGKIKNTKLGNLLTPCAYEDNKYYMVSFMMPGRKVRKKYVHRVVMEAWSPNPDPTKYDCVGFKDKNPENCSVDNLYWTNRKELMNLRREQNRYNRGEAHHFSKFTWQDIEYIRQCVKEGTKTKSELARQFEVLPCTIGAIIHNKSWKTK